MAAQIEPGVWYVIREAAPAMSGLLHSKSSALWEIVEPGARIFCDLLRQYQVQPSCLMCLICGCAIEGHLLSDDHFERLSGKLEAHAGEGSLREAFWQEIQAPGAYVVRFNHVDFEVQLCLGDPPPPHIPAKPGGNLFCKAAECQSAVAPGSQHDEHCIEIPARVLAAVDVFMESVSFAEFHKVRPPAAMRDKCTPIQSRCHSRCSKHQDSQAEVPFLWGPPAKQLSRGSSSSAEAFMPQSVVDESAPLGNIQVPPTYRSTCAGTSSARSTRSMTEVHSVLHTPPRTPRTADFPGTPPLPPLRPACAPPAITPLSPDMAPSTPEAELLPGPIRHGMGKPPGACPPNMRTSLPVRVNEHQHLVPGYLVVCLLDGAWWPATVHSFCERSGMAKVYWDCPDGNLYPTIVDARRLLPRVAATGTALPLQPRFGSNASTIRRDIVSASSASVQQVQRRPEETEVSKVFVAHELEDLESTLDSMRNAAKHAFDQGAELVVLGLKADCESAPECVPQVAEMREGSPKAPIVSYRPPLRYEGL